MSENAPKTYCFGKADDGNIEFGETYHVALTLALEPKAKVFIREFKDGEEFLNLLGLTNRIVFEKPADPADLPATPQIFSQDEEQTRSKACQIWETIKTKAKEDDWATDIKKLTAFLGKAQDPKILIWLRRSGYKSERNLTERGLLQLVQSCRHHDHNLTPVIVGPIPAEWHLHLAGTLQLGEFYRNPFFQTNSIAKQLYFLDWLHSHNNVKASVGMMSGAMDGLALFSERNVFFFEGHSTSKTRMQKVSNIFSQSMTRTKLEGRPTEENPFVKFSPKDLSKLDDFFQTFNSSATSGKS